MTHAIMGGFNRRQIVGYKDLDGLIRKEHSISFRITKGEAIDLPEQTFETRKVYFSKKEKDLYDRIKRDSYAELDSGGQITATTVLTKLLRLQQLTGGFLVKDDATRPEQVSTAKMDALLKIEELETAIEKNREQKQVLTNLMASGYLEPALFNKESNELAAEVEALRQEKDGLMRSVNGDMVKIEELQRLLRFTSKGTMMTEFDDEIFLSFVERITVLSRKEVVFEWKCGLSLKERLAES